MSEQPIRVASDQTEDPGVKALLDQIRAIWKHRMLVLAIAAATTAVVALWTLKQPKIFAATVTVEFDLNPPRPLGNQVDDMMAESESFWSSREYFITQYRVIESERVAEGVVRELGLQHDADFLGVPPNQRRGFRSVDVTTAASVLRGRLRVEPVRESRLVNISVEDTSPRRAQLLANTVAAVYIRQNLEKKLSSTVSALEWLGQQLESLRNQLESSENALHEFRLRNNLLSTSIEDRRNQVGNRIEKLSDGLTETLQRRIAAAARVTELRRAARADDPLVQGAPELLQSVILQNLRTQYELARRARDGLAIRYGTNSQQMLAAEAALTEVRDAIQHEVRNILEAAEGELRAIRHAEGDLRASLADSQREGLELNLREIQYGRLQRERENNAKLYGIVLERTKQTDLTRLSRVNNLRVLDDALLPGGPIKPRVFVNVAVGGLAGVLLGIMAAFILVQADRSVRSQADIENELRSTFLGIVPRIQPRALRLKYRYGGGHQTEDAPITNPDLVVHSHPNSSTAEAIRVIRTNLLFMSPDEPFQAIMVSSSDAREGKTTVAVSLAISIAQSGKKVLLVDCDMRRPRVHRAFGLRPPVGVTNVLVNEISLDEALVETEVPSLHLLPCGPIPPNPAELLHSQRFQELVKQARGKFDRVIIDTPPIGAVTDALVVGPQVDGSILVVRARKTLRAKAVAVLAQLKNLGNRVAGVVLNDVDLSREADSTYYYAGRYSYDSQRDVA